MKKSIKRLISFGLCFMLAFSNTCSSFSGMSVYAADTGISAASDNSEEASPSDAEVQESSDLNNQSTRKLNKLNSGLDNTALRGGSGNEDLANAEEPYISLNGNDISLTDHTIDDNSFLISYGDNISLALNNVPAGVAYILTIGSDEDRSVMDNWIYYENESANSKWGLVPGDYYVGCSFVSEDSSVIIDDTEGNYGFRVQKGTFKDPTGVEWDQTTKTAKWNAVTKTVTNGDAKEGSVSYEVKLKRGDAVIRTEIVNPTDTASQNLSFDFSSDVGTYGHYYFTVQAIPSEDYEDLYNPSSNAVLSDEYTKLDVTSPTIKSFTGADGKLTAVASDDEAGVLYYAFSKEANSSNITDWSQLDSAVVGTDKTFTYDLQDTDYGTFYFHVKDADGNVSTSDDTVKVTHIKYINYYDTSLHTKESYIFGNNAVSLEPGLTRPGYDFGGWLDASNNPVTSVTAGTDNTVTAKWVRNSMAITTQPVGFSTVYDGDDHTLTTAVDDDVVGNITWNWYRQGSDEPVLTESNNTSSSLGLKNVADSGTYYAVATIVLDDDVASLRSENAVVNITKKNLVITAENVELNYRDPAPTEYAYAAEGLVDGDSDILTGKFTSSYNSGATNPADATSVGTYNDFIIVDSEYPFVADNYSITINEGKLTVNPKTVDDIVTVELSNPDETYIYNGNPYTPGIIVKDNGNEIASDNYDVEYTNNIDASTDSKKATITVTFKNNYSGTKTLQFTIERATPTAQVVFETTSTPSASITTWPYGTKVTYSDGTNSEIILKTNTNSDSDVINYHFKDDNGVDLEGMPTNVGEYSVYVDILASNNYSAISTQDNPVTFTITKRPIDIMITGGYTIPFDGDEHFFNQVYQRVNDTSFPDGEGIQSFIINGSITDVGTLDATTGELYVITPYPGTDLENNYNVRILPNPDHKDQITITEQQLDPIEGLQWSTEVNEVGTAIWTPRYIGDAVALYSVDLYRVSTDGSEDELIMSDSIDIPKYDFADAIREDVLAQNTGADKKAYDYYFKVSVSAKDNGNYAPSLDFLSEKSAVMHTALIYSEIRTGVTDISMGQNPDGYIVMLQGESANVSITLEDGYSNVSSWSVPDVLTIKNASATSTSFTLNSDIGQSYDSVKFIAQASDEKPIIESFTGETTDNNSKVFLKLIASDSKDLTKWMIKKGDSAPSPNDSAWINIDASQIETDSGRVKITYDTTRTEVTSSGTGEYYAYVMDSAGNVTQSAPLDVYKISFNKGANEATGTMADIFKVEHVPVDLPALGYTYPGYTFVNWTTDESTYQDRAVYSEDGNATLVAHWTDKAYTYTVNYFLQDLDGNYINTPDKTAAFSCAYNTEVGPNTRVILLNQEGFTIDTEHSETKTIDSDGLSVNIYYSRNKYTLKYVLTGIDGNVNEYSSELYYGAPIVEREKTAEPGYNFIGWIYQDGASTHDVMPAHDVTATGSYIANDGQYVINYYRQSLNNDELFELYSTEVIESSTGNVIESSAGGNEIEGFTFKARHSTTNDGTPAASFTVDPSQLEGWTSESDPVVIASEGQVLNVNYFYTRDKYDLTLNVWNNEDREKIVYTKTWNVKYGAPINENDYINSEKDTWDAKASEKGVDLDKYRVSDIASWSTGLTTPETMPAGHVTVTRQYIPILKAKYKVNIFLQNASKAYDDTPNNTLIYDGAIGATVKVGRGEEFDVNISDFDFYIPYFNYCYDLDESGDTEGLVVDPSEQGNDMLVLNVKLKRKTITAKIKYFYVDLNGHTTLFASYEEEGLWSIAGRPDSTKYTVDPLLYFYGSDYEGLNDKAIANVKSNVLGQNPVDLNFNDLKCAVSIENGYNYSSSRTTYKSYGSIPKPKEAFFGTPSGYNNTSHDCYLNVYYTQLDEKSFVFDYYMNKNVSDNYLENEEKKVPITYKDTETGIVYHLRTANMCDLVDWNMAPGTIDSQYLASEIFGRSGSYGQVKEGFSIKTINGHTYYVTDSADENGKYYIYYANTANDYYAGKYCVASYNDQLRADFPMVDEWLAAYKARHATATENRDEKADALGIYNRSSNIINYLDANGNISDSEVVVNFIYGDTYYLNLILTQPSGAIERANKQFVKGSTITYNDIKTFIDSQPFKERFGYEIKWYTDTAYTQPITEETKFTNLSSDKSIYGRYEKKQIIHHLYTHYMNKDLNYVTKEDLFDGDTLKEGYVVLREETETVSYKDEDGDDQFVAVKTIVYGIDDGTEEGLILLEDIEIPGVAYTELILTQQDIESYRPSGFYYDEANTNNKTYAYCEYSPVNFHIYYARNKHTLKVDNKFDKDNVVTSSIKRYGVAVSLVDPTKLGYRFDGWEVKKINYITDQEGNVIDEEYVDLPSGISVSINGPDNYGVRTFEMPDCDIYLEAKWVEVPFDSVIRHYFETVNKTYYTGVEAEIEGKTATTVDTYFGAGSLYSLSDKSIVVIDKTISGTAYKLYFVTNSAVASESITLDPADLVMSTNTINVLSGDEKQVDSYIFPTSEGFDMFDFTFMNFIDTQMGETHQKDGITTPSNPDDDDQTKFTCRYGMELDYYYVRESELKITLVGFATDGSTDTGLSFIGDGTYLYGETANISATIGKGYTFKGWYEAADVLDNNGKLNKDKLSSATPITTDEEFESVVKSSKTYVAVSEPEDVPEATLTISGNNSYEYGYPNSSSNKLTATVTFNDSSVDSSKYVVKSYQWYAVDGDTRTEIPGANSGVLHFDAGKNAGTYTYDCKVVIEHINNGRTLEVYAKTQYDVTVAKKDLIVNVTNYEGIYDGEYHNVAVSVSGLVGNDQATIYYGTEELNAENYLDKGKTIPDFPGIKDVKKDNSGNVIPTDVYLYVVSADTVNSNYNPKASSNTVKLTPKTVTVKASASGKRFVRLYDGDVYILGDVNDANSDKYEIAHGGYLTLSGLSQADLDADLDKRLFVDFTGKYNDKNVKKAAKITLSDMHLVDGEGIPNFNYIIPSTIDISGGITPVPVTVIWPEEKSFVYNGEEQVLKPVRLDIDDSSEAKLSEEIAAFLQETSGAQKNVGNYTAHHKVTFPSSSSYQISNYNFINESSDFSIVKKTVYVAPKDANVTYDGAEHGLDEYVLYNDSGKQSIYTLPEGLTAESYTYDKKYKDAGIYNDINATGIVLKDGSINVTGIDYEINYLPGTLTIEKKKVTVEDITASDKSFDGTTDATLNLTGATIHDPVTGEALKISGITGYFDTPTQGNDKTVTFDYTNAVLEAGNANTSVENYELNVDDSQHETTANITGHEVTINTNNVEGVYGEDLSSFFGFEYGNDYTGNKFVPDDADRKVNITEAFKYKVIREGETTATDYNSSLPVGTYKIVVLTGENDNIVTGMSCDNYTFIEGTKGTLTIKKRPIVITEAVNGSDYEYNKITKEYDGNTDVLETINDTYYHFTATSDGQPSGVVSGDIVAIKDYSAAYNSKDVASANKVTLTGITLTNDNYVLKTADGTADNDTLVLNYADITKKQLTVKADNNTITYGDDAPTYTATIAEFVTGEGENDINTKPTFACEYDTSDSNKRNARKYTITPSGAEDDNYSFVYETGELTVNKSTLAVVARDKDFTYSVGPVPTWEGKIWTEGYENYEGLKYADTLESAVTGSASYDCKDKDGQNIEINTVPGTYDIISSKGTLESANYNFAFIEGTLTIHKKDVELFNQIHASGITIRDKVYDGTTTVNELDLIKPEVNSTNYYGISEDDIAHAGTGIEFDASHMSYDVKDVGNNRVVSLTYDDNGTTKFAYRLNEYLAERYELHPENSQKTILGAVINPKSLTITADNKGENPVLYYGADVPEYTATYEGFVNGETETVLVGHLILSCPYEKNDPAGNYTITASGYDEFDGNYKITLVAGELKITPNQFEKPIVKWSDTVPGVITWTKPADVGTEHVASYELQLYRADSPTGTFAKVGDAITLDASSITQTDDVYTHNYHAVLDDSKGVYKVQVKAISSEEDNVKSNISDLDNADLTYSTLVTVKFDGDGGVSTKLNNHENSYIMVAGDAFPYEATLEEYNNTGNCTGYDVASVSTSDTKLTVDPVTDAMRLKGEGTVFSGGNVTSGFDINKTDADVIIKLSKTQPYIEPSLSFEKDPSATVWNLTYGYAVETEGNYENTAPTILCTNDLGNDERNTNLTIDDYNYSYNWIVKRMNIPSLPAEYSEDTSNVNTFNFPTERKVNQQGYYVECSVTATRKDNGESATFKVGKPNYVKVAPAQFITHVELEGWKYGEARKTPIINPEHPEKDDQDYSLTYEYSSNEGSGYTTNVPQDAGTYYVRAKYTATENYEGNTTAPTSFVIEKAKLANPANVTLLRSPVAPYGGLQWDAVEGPKENGNSTTNFITPKYEVKLYKKTDDSSEAECKFTKVFESTDERKVVDWTEHMTEQGHYYFTVQAISDNPSNCDNSDIVTTRTIDITRTIHHDRSPIVYDGQPINMWLEGDAIPQGATFKWFKDGIEITGATDAEYQITDVAQSGHYTCEVTAGGITETYSTIDNLIISRRPIIITTDSGDKIYDGTPLTKNVVSGDVKNYKIELDPSVPKEQETDREGKPYICNTPLVSGDEETMTISGSQTVVGSSYNPFAITIKHNGSEIINASFDEDDSNIAFTYDNYIITPVIGTLSVTKREVKVIVDSKEKVYGENDPQLTWHIDPDTPLESGVPLAGITVSRETGENVKDGGYAITATQAANANPNYNITFVPGTFTIKQKELIIKADSKEKVYKDDDPELTYETYTKDSGGNEVAIDRNSLPFEDKLTVTLTREGDENFGTDGHNIVITSATLKDKTDTNDVTGNYNITLESNTLDIQKKQIKITPVAATKVYGKQDPEFDYTVASVSGNKGVSKSDLEDGSISVTRADGENVAEYEMTASQTAGANPNYNIEFVSGVKFTITPAELTVTAHSKTKVYGEADPVLTYEVTGLTNGDIESAVIEGALVRTSGENVGEYDINQGSIKLKDGNNNYTLQYVPNKLEITQKPIKVIPTDMSKTYGDNDPTTLEYTVENNALVQGDTINITLVREPGEDVKEGGYTITASQNDGDNPNYSIDLSAAGTFTINKMPLTVKADPQTKIYGDDDPTLTYEVDPASLPFGDTLNVTLNRATGDNVGEYPIGMTSATVINGNKDVTENYEITYDTAPVCLEIQKKSIKLIPDNDSKTYGDPDPTTFTYKVEAVNGKGAGQEMSGVALNNIRVYRDPGEIVVDTPYTIHVALEDGATAGANPNYDINFDETGSFTINQKAITVTAGSKSRRYDGTPLTDDTYKITDTNSGAELTSLPRNDSVSSIIISGTITNTGYVPNVVSDMKISNSVDGDVTSSYAISYEEGRLSITSGQLIVTADSAEKVYDGTPLTVSTVTCKDALNPNASGLADGEIITATVEGSQVDVGESNSSITEGTVKIINALGEDVTSSYDISELKTGTLKVTKRPVTITAGGATREYDGTPFEVTEFTTDNLVAGHSATDLTWSYTKKDSSDPNDLTSVGEITNTITDAKIVDEIGTDVTPNYAITFVSGTSTVTKKTSVTIKTKSDEKTYDGTELVNDGYDLDGNLANGDTIESFVSGTRPKNAGSYENVPSTIVIKNSLGQDVTSNYDLGYDYGTLTINKRQVTFTSLGDEKIYDGTPLTNSEVVISGDGMVPGENVVFNVTGSQTYVGSSENTFTYTITSGNRRMLNARTSRLFAAPPILAAPAPVAPVNPEDNYAITKIQQPLVVTDTGIVTTTKTHEDKTYKLGDTITFEISITNIYDSAKDITLTEKSGVVFENGSNVYVISDVPSGETRTVKATHVVTEEDIANGSGAYDNTVDVKFDGVTTDHSAEDSAKIDVPSPSWYIDFDIVSDSPDGVAKYKVGDTITYRLKITNDGNQSITVKDISDVFTREDGSKVILSDAALAKLRSLVGTTIKPGEAAEVEFDYLTVDADKDTKLLNTIDVTITTKESDGASSVKEVSETLSADATSISVEAADEAVAPDATVKEPEKSVKAANTKSPGTADNTPLAGAMVMLVLSAAGILAVIRKRRTL